MVFLAAESLRSAAVGYGLELARQARRRTAGGPKLMAVRMACAAPIPPLAAEALGAGPVVDWGGPADDERVAREVLQAMMPGGMPAGGAHEK